MEVAVGRVYDHRPADGRTRVLVDRLWPRGIQKEAPPWDVWMKAVAPSTGLRTWYHAHPDAVDEFRRRYQEELAAGEEQRQALAQLRALAEEGGVLLLTAARAVALSQAPVLRDVFLAQSGHPAPDDFSAKAVLRSRLHRA